MKTLTKTFVFFGLLLWIPLFTTPLYADDTLDDFPVPLGAKWAKLYPEAMGRSIVATPSGYVIAGRQNGPDSSQLLDYWSILVGYNTSGNFTGSKTFDLDEDHNEAFDIIASFDEADTLDGYIITGAKHKAYSTEDGHNYYNPYMWIMKTGTNLERIWEYRFGDPFNDYGYNVFNDGSGFIISGKYSNPNESGYLVRTDESGVMTWEASYATEPRWEFMHVIYDSAPAVGGGLIVATDNGLHKLSAYTTTERPSDTSVWSASGSDILQSVIKVSDGYVATGYVEVSGGDDHMDLVLIKVGTNGSVAWRHTFGRSAPALGAEGMNDYGYEVIQTSDGGFTIIGSTQSYAWHGKSDMWLIKTNSAGVLQWDIVAGDADEDTGRGIVQDAANDLVVCGTTTYDDGSGIKDWIYTVNFSNSYAPPIPSFTYNPASPFYIQEPVHFNASGSVAGGTGNSLILYEWDFGDGHIGTGITTDHIYIAPGTYTVTLYVTDNNGIRRETSQTLTAVGLITQWERTFGNGNDWFYDLAEGDGDNLLLCGINCITTSNCSTWITKVDSYGRTLWGNTYPDSYTGGRDGARKAILGHDGNYIVAGFRDKEIDGKTRDLRVLKINALTGVKIWDKSYDFAGGSDEAFDLKPISTGGYVIAGYATVITSPTDIDMWLIKLDENGDIVWDETYSNTEALSLKGSAVATADDGGFLILGARYASFSDQDIIAVKTNSTGVEGWRHTISHEAGKHSNWVSWAHQKSNGDFSLAGTLNNDYAYITLEGDGSPHHTISWGTTFDRDYIVNADTTPDGGYVLVGTQYSVENDDDTYMARLDSNGNLAWDMTIGEPGDSENGEAVAYLSDGSIIILHTDYEDKVTRLTKISPNTLSVGDFTFSPASPFEGQSVTFTAVVNDAEGTVSKLTWQFGAGEGDPVDTTSSTIDHTYSNPGSYTVTLTAYDTSGGEIVITHDVTVTESQVDLCPDDPDKYEPGICGCGVSDTDTDGDAIANCIDNCSFVMNADQTNTDGDALGNACDDDDDNDGMPDAWEILYTGLDPLVDDADGDLDHDGISNYEEYLAGTSPVPVRHALPFIPLLLGD